MNRLLNPFRYIAGTRALILGTIFIVATALLEWSGGIVQDGYLHYALKSVGFGRVLVADVVSWLLPTALLYVAGVWMSHSRIRPIDMLGTMAFARLLIVPTVVPMLIPAVQNVTMEIISNPMAVTSIPESSMLWLSATGIWATAWLVLYWIWSYNAFAVSCNVRGAKAVAVFVGVQIACTLFGGLIFGLLVK